MSTTIKTGWLKDSEGNKFAAKTLMSQVQTNDGISLEDKIQSDLETTKAEILEEVADLNNSNVAPHHHDDRYYTESEMDTKIVALNSAIAGKADSSHDHNDVYYTEAEIDTKLESKSDTTHKHDSDYDAKGSADAALASAKSYTDTKTSTLASTSSVNTSISNHNASTSAHEDIRTLISDLSTAVNNFLDVDDATTDQLSEVLTLINNNKGTLESLTTSKINVSDIVNNLTTNSASKVLSAAQGVTIKGLIDALQTELDSHTHAISDVVGLQSALDGKAASSHGTHVSYSTTAPVMDGTASVGSAGTVARSDHRHPTDTSRASQTDLEALETVVASKANSSHTHAISDVTNLQSSLDAKQATVTGGASTITSSNLTANRALVSNGSGKVAVSAVTSTELGYLDGVTSNIQTQLDDKVDVSDLNNYYTKTQIDNLELITVDDIDAICGTVAQIATLSEVAF